MIRQAPLEAAAAWAYSSVVEHCVDIAGVASSILATPTIFPLMSTSARRVSEPAFICPREGGQFAIAEQQGNFA